VPVSIQDVNHSTMDMLMMAKSKCDGFYVHSRLTAVQVCKCRWACKFLKTAWLPLYFCVCLKETVLCMNLPSHHTLNIISIKNIIPIYNRLCACVRMCVCVKLKVGPCLQSASYCITSFPHGTI